MPAVVPKERVEAAWGADPLEYIGGFRALQYDATRTFPSSLASGGQAGWSTQQAELLTEHTTAAVATLKVEFTNVDWQLLQAVYGWAALQYQAWTRGYISINSSSSQSVLLYTDQVLEYWIDDNHHFGGDYFGYRKAPLIVHLAPGCHKFDVRLIRDTRAMGGFVEPTLSIKVRVEANEDGLVAISHQFLVSDIVDGRLASPFASVPLRNGLENAIELSGVSSATVWFRNISALELSLMESEGSNRGQCIGKSTSETGARSIKTTKFSYLAKGPCAPEIQYCDHLCQKRRAQAPDQKNNFVDVCCKRFVQPASIHFLTSKRHRLVCHS